MRFSSFFLSLANVDSVLAADVRDLGLAAHLAGELQQVIVAGRPIDLAEEQILLERRADDAEEIAQLRRRGARGNALAERHRFRRLELLAFVGHEEVHPVADDRAAERDAVLLLLRLRLAAVARFDRIGRAPVLGGVVGERFGFELVRARARHGDDAGAAELVELCLVVRRDDLVFADGELRERIAAGQSLAADAAAQHVVLLADAVDEHVHAVRRLRAAADLAGRAVGAGRELHARDDVREREEVARVLRQRFDLPRGHVRRDFGGARLEQLRGDDRHRLDVLVALPRAPGPASRSDRPAA